MFFLCIPWKQSGNLLTFLRGREREHWPEVGKGTPRVQIRENTDQKKFRIWTVHIVAIPHQH